MNIETKYSIDDVVYILSEKKIFRSRISEVRVEVRKPHQALLVPYEIVDRNGIKIEYLVITSEVIIPGITGTQTNYDWYDEKDIFISKEELIANI